MSAVLFVVPPLVGHINPTIGVARELRARGHRVAWAGHAELLRRLAGPDATVFDCDPGTASRPDELRGPAALEFLWARFLVPLAETMALGVRAAIDRFTPDVIVADQQALAGGLIAERAGVPWLTSATTSAELADPLAGMPKVAEWVGELLARLRVTIGDPGGTADPRFSPHGVLAFTTPALAGDVAVPATVHFVGPSLTIRPSTPDFPWSWLDPATPTVLVSLGTANASRRFLHVSVEALAARAGRVRTIIVDPSGHLADRREPWLLVREYVPQLELLPKLAAVVCHAGHNTVCESLWHGVPLVVAPIRDDQPIVAEQVAAAGAGVRVRFTRVTPDRLGAAVDEVLDPAGGHRAAAAAIGRSFAAAGGAARAASLVERLCATDSRSQV